MFKNAFKYKRVLSVVIILSTLLYLVVISRGQDQKVPTKTGSQKKVVDKEKTSTERSSKGDNASKVDKEKKNTQKAAESTAPPVENANQERGIESPDLKRVKQAQDVIENIFQASASIPNPVVRMKVRMLVADAYWNFQPAKAREILSEDFPQIASISVPQHELNLGKIWSIRGIGKPPIYKDRELEMVKAQLRREMLSIISAHDTALARSLVASEKKEEEKDGRVSQRNRADEVLSTAGSLADTNPEAAARIIRESVKNGVSEELSFLLIRLREKSPDDASAIFNLMFSAVSASGNILEFQKLVPYVLPTEKDRLIGGKHYLTDPQRMKDAIMLMEYAIVLLARRIESEPPGTMSPELVRKETYIWRNLLPVFKDLKPESVWLVNTRISQLSALIPQSQQGPVEGPWSDERLKKLIALAESSVGEKRDDYLESAAFNAWRFGGGDFDLAVSLAEKIDNRELRDDTSGVIHFQAGMKTLNNEGPDQALNLVKKIKSPVMRSRLYIAIIGALRAVKARQQVDALQEDLLSWLRGCESNTETAWGLLEYLNHFSGEDVERGFTALHLLIGVLNSANLDAPEKPLRRKVYWYPEFHDFRTSLGPLARTDFERGLQTIQMLNNTEVAPLIQTSYCGEYLKIHGKSKKLPANHQH
jgi:hypothetical protein